MAAKRKASKQQPTKIEPFDSDTFPLVAVTWVDITSFEGWKSLKEVRKLTPAIIKSVGYLVGENSEYVIIVPHFEGVGETEEDLLCGSTHCIPRAVIQKLAKM